MSQIMRLRMIPDRSEPLIMFEPFDLPAARADTAGRQLVEGYIHDAKSGVLAVADYKEELIKLSTKLGHGKPPGDGAAAAKAAAPKKKGKAAAKAPVAVAHVPKDPDAYSKIPLEDVRFWAPPGINLQN